ncbi:MAG: hypothetical protein Q8K18_18310 [Burkholderiales bacterium]|nr:hypothetical protein [Burkholderiales bacterium]
MSDNLPSRRSRMPVVATVFIFSVFAAAAYLSTKAPDVQRAEVRAGPPDVLKSPADIEAYAGKLRAHLEQQPDDARSWVLLARMQAELERFPQATQAYEKALALPSKVARDPLVWCEYADALGMAQGGKLAGKPRELIARALALDAHHPKALEMAGSAAYEQGNFEETLRYWRPLLATLGAGSREHRELTDAIARTERLAAAK